MTTFRSEPRRSPGPRCSLRPFAGRARHVTRLRLLVTLLAMLGAAAACSETPSPPPSPGPQSEVAPAHLLATFQVAQPDQLYALARTKAPTLPRSLPVFAAHLLGLPPMVAGRLRSNVDLLGAVAVDERQRATVALALPLVSGRELVAELTLGADAPFQAHPARRVTELRGASIGPLGALSLGVSGNVLIVGTSSRAVHELGPYLAHHKRGELDFPLREPGVAVQTVASGPQLQGLLGQVAQGNTPDVRPGADPFPQLPLNGALRDHPLFGSVLFELLRSVSAYLGHIKASSGTLVLDGNVLRLEWQAQTTTLPLSAGDGRAACRDLAALPPGAGPWLLGAGALPTPPVSPDWDLPDPEWQVALSRRLALAPHNDAPHNKAPPSDAAPKPEAATTLASQAAPWLLSAFEANQEHSLIAVLHGVSLATLHHAVPAPHQTASMQNEVVVNRKGLVREGKAAEVAWAARGPGVVVASGAPLGDVWSQLGREPEAVQIPRFLTPRTCEGLIAAIGDGSAGYVAVSKRGTALMAEGSIDLRALGASGP